MVQAIINMNMPESCLDCPYSKGNYTMIICRLSGDIEEDTGSKWAYRMHSCPLREYKEKKYDKEKKSTHNIS